MTIQWANIAGPGFVERTQEVSVLAMALLTREHALFIGDPGTAKSAIVNAVCKSLGGQYFSLLMTRFTTPEEVFGPLSLKALEVDEYKRVTGGYLPSATVGFLDEVFKANSAILNSLLGILNERVFFEHGKAVKVPLELCVGASNELPDDDSGLEALYDRFLFRQVVKPIEEQGNFVKYLMGGEPAGGAPIDPVLLDGARMAVQNVRFSADIAQKMVHLKNDLRRQKPAIDVSDRRWKKAVKAMRAHAYLRGSNDVAAVDFWALVYVLWKHPDEIEPIKKLLAKYAGLPQQDFSGLASAAATVATGLSQHAQQYVPPPSLKVKAMLDYAKKTPATRGQTMAMANEHLQRIDSDASLTPQERESLRAEWNAILSEMA